MDAHVASRSRCRVAHCPKLEVVKRHALPPSDRFSSAAAVNTLRVGVQAFPRCRRCSSPSARSTPPTPQRRQPRRPQRAARRRRLARPPASRRARRVTPARRYPQHGQALRIAAVPQLAADRGRRGRPRFWIVYRHSHARRSRVPRRKAGSRGSHSVGHAVSTLQSPRSETWGVGSNAGIARAARVAQIARPDNDDRIDRQPGPAALSGMNSSRSTARPAERHAQTPAPGACSRSSTRGRPRPRSRSGGARWPTRSRSGRRPSAHARRPRRRSPSSRRRHQRARWRRRPPARSRSSRPVPGLGNARDGAVAAGRPVHVVGVEREILAVVLAAEARARGEQLHRPTRDRPAVQPAQADPVHVRRIGHDAAIRGVWRRWQRHRLRRATRLRAPPEHVAGPVRVGSVEAQADGLKRRGEDLGGAAATRRALDDVVREAGPVDVRSVERDQAGRLPGCR